jgi:hypothetical protein
MREEHFYCPICGTELESSRALRDHETEHHSKQQKIGDASPGEQANEGRHERKDRNFERRNWE